MNNLYSAFAAAVAAASNNNNNNNNNIIITFRLSASPSYTFLTFLRPPNITPFFFDVLWTVHRDILVFA